MHALLPDKCGTLESSKLFVHGSLPHFFLKEINAEGSHRDPLQTHCLAPTTMTSVSSTCASDVLTENTKAIAKQREANKPKIFFFIIKEFKLYNTIVVMIKLKINL
jgi:hypothetical protein